MTTTKNNIPAGYKDSAVGIIPQEWEVKRVKDIGKVVTGSTPPTTDASNYGNEYMFVSPADLSDRQKYIYCTEKMLSSKGYNKSRKIPKGAVLYTCIGSTIGKIGIAPCELSSNQQINAVICKNDNEYLYYVLLYRTGQIRMLAGKQAVPIINKSDFENIKLAVPPLAEQKKIAEILGIWDEAIEKQNLLIEKLELRKRALMQRLLTGKTRLPGFTTPVDYKQLKPFIVEVSERNAKQTITEVLSVTNSRGFVSQIEQFDREVASANTTNYKVIRKGQFAYNPSRVNVGSLDLLRTFEVGILSPMYVVFKTLPTISTQYLYYLLKSNWFIGHIPMYVQGSVRDSLSFDGLRDMKFWLPSLPEQKAIAEVLTTADNEIAIHRKTLDALRQQKRGLMQQLLTGKTRVKI